MTFGQWTLVQMNKRSPLSPFRQLEGAVHLPDSSERCCRIEPSCLQWWTIYKHTFVLAFSLLLLTLPAPYSSSQGSLPQINSAGRSWFLENPRLRQKSSCPGIGLLSETVTVKNQNSEERSLRGPSISSLLIYLELQDFMNQLKHCLSKKWCKYSIWTILIVEDSYPKL